MIQEITKIICDNCGKGIIDFPERLLVRDYKSLAKKYNWITVNSNKGRRDFCDEQCYKEWKEKHAKGCQK